MVERKIYRNIPVSPEFFQELRRLKSQYEADTGGVKTWTVYLRYLATQPLVAEMGGDDPITQEQLDALGVELVQNDALACEIAPMVGARIELSDSSIQKIATQLHQLLSG